MLLPLLLCATGAAPYVPPPASEVPGYFEEKMPCRIAAEMRDVVHCKDNLLEKMTLRELSIARNTIYARYGWDGYRKPWLREHFHAQPWFKPNPQFTYKVLSAADKANAHFVAVREQSLTDEDLRDRQNTIYARAGKIFDDKPEWELADGSRKKACKAPKGAKDPEENEGAAEFSLACRFEKQSWYKADRNF